MCIFYSNSEFSNALKNAFKFEFSGEMISSLIVMLIIAIFSFVVYFKFKKANPFEDKPTKFISLISTMVQTLNNFVVEIMGKKWKKFSGYALCIILYIFLAFIFSLTGLPGPMTSLVVPLSLALCTFILIHATAIKANKWKYFTRFTDPLPPYIPVFIPINLLSMWSPLLSLSLRLFGNAMSGYVLMTLVYTSLSNLSAKIFSFINSGINQIFIAPFITPVLHAYFDLFSGVIQTLVFVMLTMIFVSNEDPDTEETSI